MTKSAFDELKRRLTEVNDLYSAAALLNWDQATYMPPGGAAARGRQLGTLQQIAHERFANAEIGKLIDQAESYIASRPYDSDEASMVRVARRDFERATKIPTALVARSAKHYADSYQAWGAARPKNDFKSVMPFLEEAVNISRETALCFPGFDHIADPLIDMHDEGMRAVKIRAIFSELREELVPLVRAVTAKPVADTECLRRIFPESQQLALGEEVIKRFGYDFNRGRQDKTLHPFMTKFALGDIRITTRVREDNFSEGFFSTLHEAGHALYEQGIKPDLDGCVLAGGCSSGVHESQSRLWENVIGRSRGFWEYYYPKLQKVFAQQLQAVDLDSFYRAINKVEQSLIRTNADELTYNLHVMIRFDLELKLLEETLKVRDLPEAWNAAYKSDLGVNVPDHSNGVMQDVHWYGVGFGGVFQGYTLGNIMAALFFSKACEVHPDIPKQIRSGSFDSIRSWLTNNVYQHGRKFMPDELLKRVTGGELTIKPYVEYLKGKFGELYSV